MIASYAQGINWTGCCFLFSPQILSYSNYWNKTKISSRGLAMCDLETQQDADEYLNNHSELSRREFTRLAAGAGMAMIMPSIASAQSISERDVEIRTPDGVADCHFAYPSTGSHAAVLVWPDILALRPAFRQMGRRLAREGYAVLTVNPFYRNARSPIVGLGASFGQPEIRNL